MHEYLPSAIFSPFLYNSGSPAEGMVPLIVGSSSHLKEHNEDNPPQACHKPASSRQPPSSQKLQVLSNWQLKLNHHKTHDKTFICLFPYLSMMINGI